MIRAIFLTWCFAVSYSSCGATIPHDQVQPFAEPEPVTISEIAAVKKTTKFKPELQISSGCVSYPAVNDAGETSGGLKGTNGASGCKEAPLGSQVYGRSVWYQGFASRRHDWTSMVVWIDNPAFETPRILGVSLSKSIDGYAKYTEISVRSFAGTKIIPTYHLGRTTGANYVPGSNTSIRVYHEDSTRLHFNDEDGECQDLIMWNQLTDEARMALNTTDFGKAKVPFNDENFVERLLEAWPF